jgi:hypothetical protein
VRYFRGRPFISSIGYPDCKVTYNPPKAREAIDAGTLKQDAAAVAAAREKYERIKQEREEEKKKQKEESGESFEVADAPEEEAA